MRVLKKASEEQGRNLHGFIALSVSSAVATSWSNKFNCNKSYYYGMGAEQNQDL